VEVAYFKKRTRTSGPNFEVSEIKDPRYEVRPLNEIVPGKNYRPNEVAIEDEFNEAYAGKLYGREDHFGDRRDYADARATGQGRSLYEKRPSELITMGTEEALWASRKIANDDGLTKWTSGMFGAF